MEPDVPYDPTVGKIRTLSESLLEPIGTVGSELNGPVTKKSSIKSEPNNNEIVPGGKGSSEDSDLEKSNEHIPYPKSVFFIISNEFCERFTYYGMRTILSIYLHNQLEFDADTSTVIYHVWAMFCYFFPVFGAIIADSWLGKFKTIFYLSVVYAIGSVVVSVAAIPDLLPARELTLVGLIVIAIGTGGIKPCVSAFGGDQFVLPQQEAQLAKFFSLFYFAINAGSLISTFLTPVLREDITCFGQDTCYSLAFGIPAMLMVVSLVIFLIGSRWYKTKTPQGNVVVEVCKVMWYAGFKKSPTKREHWLDKADDKFDKTFIDDVKAALRVLVLYIPLPIFWALFDQQGSRWTFQATRMTGELNGFKLKPDQMQVVNPVLILVFIPLFETVVYPLLAKCNLLKRPLQRLCVGGVLAALAFIISAIVETQLEPTYAILPQEGEGQIRIYNALPCDLSLTTDIPSNERFVLKSLEVWTNINITVTGNKNFKVKAPKPDCLNQDISGDITVFENEATSYTFMSNGTILQVRDENIDKSDNGDPTVMIIYSQPERYDGNIEIGFYDSDNEKSSSFIVNMTYPYVNFTKIDTTELVLKVNETEVQKNVIFDQGGAYTLVIVKNENNYTSNYTTITTPNTVHMLWLIPQYFVITAGEVMFSITGLEFSFTQAPVSMKSLMQSVWLITVAFGNLVVVIVAEAKIFSSQTYEFLLFAGLMLVDMLIFALMAMKYKYVEDINKDANENVELKDKKDGKHED